MGLSLGKDDLTELKEAIKVMAYLSDDATCKRRLAAKYGGGIFLLIYIVLALTFGYTMIIAETTLGRMTKKSPVGAFHTFAKTKFASFSGWINAIIPILIVPYYSVIGGWVIKYLFEYLKGDAKLLATDTYFSTFISNGVSTEICFILFTFFTLAIIY